MSPTTQNGKNNKDEAKHYVELAEVLISERKFKQARKLLLKAQKLYPLDIINTHLTTINVKLNYDNKDQQSHYQRSRSPSQNSTKQNLPSAHHNPHVHFQHTNASQSNSRRSSFMLKNVTEIKRILNCKHDDHYAILEVNNTATLEVIKKAYRDKIKMIHPDKNSPSYKKQAHEAFLKFEKAFKYLSNKHNNQTNFQARPTFSSRTNNANNGNTNHTNTNQSYYQRYRSPPENSTKQNPNSTYQNHNKYFQSRPTFSFAKNNSGNGNTNHTNTNQSYYQRYRSPPENFRNQNQNCMHNGCRTYLIENLDNNTDAHESWFSQFKCCSNVCNCKACTIISCPILFFYYIYLHFGYVGTVFFSLYLVIFTVISYIFRSFLYLIIKLIVIAITSTALYYSEGTAFSFVMTVVLVLALVITSCS